jgi:hypothetical protein
MKTRAVLAGIAVLALAACVTYQDDLARGQKAFEANDHDRAIAIFRGLEPDTRYLSVEDQARYAYLRGMTDYRVGYKNEARHWLAFATAIETDKPGALPGDWAKRMTDALKELNEEVYTGGIQALTNEKGKAAPETDTSSSEKKKTKTDEEP